MTGCNSHRSVTGDLNLIFPQWQGSGKNNRLFYGAVILAAACPDLDFTTVPVPQACELEIRNRILGYDQIRAQMQAAGEIIAGTAPRTILTLGGDCGAEVMPVSWLNRTREGRVTVLCLDAHADLNTPETSPSGHFHGMPLAALMGLGDPALCRTAFSHLSPDQIVLAGLRNPDPAEEVLAGKMTRISADEMAASPERLVSALRDKGNDHLYIHVDLDILDPGYFPHVGCPEPGGLTPEKLIRILEMLKDGFSLAGLGLMEFILPEAAQARSDTIGFLQKLIRIFR